MILIHNISDERGDGVWALGHLERGVRGLCEDHVSCFEWDPVREVSARAGEGGGCQRKPSASQSCMLSSCEDAHVSVMTSYSRVSAAGWTSCEWREKSTVPRRSTIPARKTNGSG